MKRSSLLVVLLASAACSDPITVPTTAASSMGTQALTFSEPSDPPLASSDPQVSEGFVDATSCQWMGEQVKQFVAQLCPDGPWACAADHRLPTVSELQTGQVVYVWDRGPSPHYGWTDYPAQRCGLVQP